VWYPREAVERSDRGPDPSRVLRGTADVEGLLVHEALDARIVRASGPAPPLAPRDPAHDGSVVMRP